MRGALRRTPIHFALRKAGLHDVVLSGNAEPGFVVYRCGAGDPTRMVLWVAPPGDSVPDEWDEHRREALRACEAALKAKAYFVDWHHDALFVLVPLPEGKTYRETKAGRRAQRDALRSALYYGSDHITIPRPSRIPREEAGSGDGQD